MKIQIRLAKAQASFNGGEKNAVCTLESGRTLDVLIDRLDLEMNGIKSSILGPDHTIADSINIYVNGENVRYLDGLSTTLADGDQVGIIPAAAAG